MNLNWKGGLTIVVMIVGVALIAYQMGQGDAGEAVSSNNDKAVQQASAPSSSSESNVNNVLVNNQSDAVEKSKFTHFQVGNRNVKSIFADGKIMWVGTSGGVVRYDTTSDEHRLYSVLNGLLANGVFYVGRIKGQIAVGTYGGGLSLLDESTDRWTTYNVPEGLGDAFVYDVVEMPNGDIWIATWTGVNLIKGGDLDDPDKWSVFTVENTNGGVPNDWVYALAEGKNGELWMATEGGLARYADNTWTNWAHDDGLGAPYEQVRKQNPFKNDPADYSAHHARQKKEQGLEHVDSAYNPNYIVSLAVDAEGVVWAGTWGGGLSRYDGEEWKVFTMDDGLPANHIFMLHVDQQKRLWIGTSKGLSRMETDGSIRVYSTADGLFSNTIFSMATQDEGTLWIGSYGGVARIKTLL
ncbi:MAG: two-component regulator propeller domain-containing protein [Porticoccus sp.]